MSATAPRPIGAIVFRIHSANIAGVEITIVRAPSGRYHAYTDFGGTIEVFEVPDASDLSLQWAASVVLG